MIKLDDRIRNLVLYIERTQRVLDLIRLEAPPKVIAYDMNLVGESVADLKDSLKVGDATNVIRIAYGMYQDQLAYEKNSVVVSGCCSAEVLPPDICSQCKEHCDPVREEVQ